MELNILKHLFLIKIYLVSEIWKLCIAMDKKGEEMEQELIECEKKVEEKEKKTWMENKLQGT